DGDFPTIVFRLQLPLFRLRIRIAKAATPDEIHASVPENHFFQLAKNRRTQKVNYYTYRWDGNVYYSNRPNKIVPIPADKDYVIVFMLYTTKEWDPYIYTSPSFAINRV
ncbi:hypothetical protein IWQ62_005980, partial [Dispira parvispora]